MAGWFVLLLLFIFNPCNLNVYCQYYRSANLSTSWKNNISSYTKIWTFIDGSSVRPILMVNTHDKPNFGFGFYKNGTTNSSFYLAILKIPLSNKSSFNMSKYPPVVLWTANRDQPVRENASLDLTADGNLELRDGDDTLIWSTNTTNASVASMILRKGGYLTLFSANDDMKWDSGDYPTDTWLPRQHINFNQTLTSRVSMSNISTGLFYLSIANDGVYINRKLDPPRLYHTLFSFHGGNASFSFGIGSLDYKRNYVKYQATGEDFQYMRLEPDGHLRVYQLVDGYKNILVSDLIVHKSAHKISYSVKRLVISLLSTFFSILIIGLCCYYRAMWRKAKNVSERGSRIPVLGEEREGDESSNQELDVLKNFSYEELESATQTFRVSLGRGGFGTVFEGTLRNGMKVAVKQLGSDVHQGWKEFLAEVRILGSIHHFNLVKLVGYCTTRLKRLLVYEFMCNGSLDKWIFHKEQAQTLTWQIRRKIIVGIAEGLKYLHVHCNPTIVHFDVKPQNILLDKDFNVKIADFGLAKLIRRDESEAYTKLKGTRGYIAPELFRGENISVNVDVYSFGIVILEIICGRKNLGSCDDEFLTNIVKIKVEEDQLYDLVDKCADMQSNVEDAVRMMEIAIWCLQPYFRRPSISMVTKVLEGSMAMEPLTDYSFLSMEIPSDAQMTQHAKATYIRASILSEPR